MEFHGEPDNLVFDLAQWCYVMYVADLILWDKAIIVVAIVGASC